MSKSQLSAANHARRPRRRGGVIPIALLLALLGSGACAPGEPGSPAPAGATVDGAAATITATDLKQRIGYLASDELRGRDTPSPGLEAAAEYLAGEFRRLGLQPAGEAGTYIQRYPYLRTRIDPASARITYDGPGTVPVLVYARDFFLLPAQPAAASGAPAFIGGLARVAAAMPAGLDGRIAVVLLDAQPGPQLISAPRAAAEAGAAGMLIVLPPQVTPEMTGMIAEQVAAGGIDTAPLPVFGIRWEHAVAIFAAAGIDLGQLAQAGQPAQPVVVPNTTLTLEGSSAGDPAMVPNVVAVLPGSDPALRDEYVLLTAHFDHVGVGKPDATGDSIYNGADDDASGTAVVLEAAEAMAALAEPPARSVAFLLVSGEEKGLLGSLHFAESPTIPMERVVANINMDMVGRGGPDTLVAIGQEYTSLGELSHALAAGADIGLTLIEDPNPAEQAFFRSDHVAFMKLDIPAIFFTTWLHEDYHKPSDEVELIDGPKIARIGRLVFRLTHEVADAPQAPVWVDGGLEKVRAVLKSSPF